VIDQQDFDSIRNLHGEFLAGIAGGQRADFRKKDLSGLKLADADLSTALLVATKATSCELTDVVLSGAYMFCADFRAAVLVACDLRRIDGRGIDFGGARLGNCDLRESDLRPGMLLKAGAWTGEEVATSFAGATMDEFRLDGARIVRGDFTGRDAGRRNALRRGPSWREVPRRRPLRLRPRRRAPGPRQLHQRLALRHEPQGLRHALREAGRRGPVRRPARGRAAGCERAARAADTRHRRRHDPGDGARARRVDPQRRPGRRARSSPA